MLYLLSGAGHVFKQNAPAGITSMQLYTIAMAVRCFSGGWMYSGRSHRTAHAHIVM